MISISHPTGNQNSRNAILAASQTGELNTFYTSIAFSKYVTQIPIPQGIKRLISKRSFQEARGSKIKCTNPARELKRILFSPGSKKSVDRLYQAFDIKVAMALAATKTPPKLIHCYEDGASKTFYEARKRGIHRSYELPIGYWRAHRAICEEEKSLNPRWSASWKSINDSEQKNEKKDQEIRLATKIVVPGHFVKKTLDSFPGDKPDVEIIPYGCPDPLENKEVNLDKKLKVIFVGKLSQRKGVSYLASALKPFKDSIAITIIGDGPAEALLKEDLPNATFLKHLPHDTVLRIMSQHDLFIFPSLFEGFGLVVSEALSMGMPVITTPNTPASDLINNTEAGKICEIRNYAEIESWVDYYEKNRGELENASKSAMQIARNNSWDKYREKLYNYWKGIM